MTVLRSCRLKWRETFAGERADSGGERRRELAGSEGVKGAEAFGEFGVGQAALAVERAEKIVSRAIAFLGVALETAGDKVAVGIASQEDARDNMVDTATRRRNSAQAIKATAAFASMDGSAQRLIFHEIHFAGVNRARQAQLVASSARVESRGVNLVGEKHLDDVAGFAAFDEAQSTSGDEAAHSGARRAIAKASAAGEPGHGETESELAFQASVAQEMRVDGAVGAGEAQPRDEQVFDLFVNEFGVGFFDFHNVSPLSSECGCGAGTVQSLITVVQIKFSRGNPRRNGGKAPQKEKGQIA